MLVQAETQMEIKLTMELHYEERRNKPKIVERFDTIRCKLWVTDYQQMARSEKPPAIKLISLHF